MPVDTEVFGKERGDEMTPASYEAPKLYILGGAAQLTQGSGFGGCSDPGAICSCDCLLSATDAFCKANPTDPFCVD